MNSLRKLWRAAKFQTKSRAKVLADFVYYLEKGHTVPNAWQMARNTL